MLHLKPSPSCFPLNRLSEFFDCRAFGVYRFCTSYIDYRRISCVHPTVHFIPFHNYELEENSMSNFCNDDIQRAVERANRIGGCDFMFESPESNSCSRKNTCSNRRRCSNKRRSNNKKHRCSNNCRRCCSNKRRNTSNNHSNCCQNTSQFNHKQVCFSGSNMIEFRVWR